MRLFEPQPAHLIYSFGAGWKVMQYVWRNVFVRTDAAARTWFNFGSRWKLNASTESTTLLRYWKWCLAAACFLAGVFQYIGAMLFVTVSLAMQLVLLVAWASAVMLLILFWTFINLAHSYYYKIFVRCPACYTHMHIPIYVCPRCATEHSRLWPSVYGIFFHRCSACDTKLPALGFLGRRHLIRKCIACSRPMNKKIGELINVHIPVIGGPSSGKSNYIFTATHDLIDSYAKPRRYIVEFPEKQDELEYTRNLSDLSLGRVLAKTPDITPQAYNVVLKRPGDHIGRIVYIYDAAGEAYATEDNTMLQKYYDYVDGLIFVIDPFSIDLYRQKHEREVNAMRDALRPSALGVMDAYERMITVLEGSVGLKSGGKFRHPVAVVISKTDAFDLPDRIGRSAAGKLMQSEPSICAEEDAIHLLVEKFLIENEMGNLVRDLYLEFEHVRFFSCSALGRMPDGHDRRAFEPVGVLEPLLWILSLLGVVRAAIERGLAIDAKHRSIARAKGHFLASSKFYYWDSLRPRQR